MSRIESNFEAWLSDLDGKQVPGSLRRGHNIITRYGKDWLAELVRWTFPVAFVPSNGLPPLTGGSDTAAGGRRLRWIAAGTGSPIPLEDDDIQKLLNAIPYQLGPNNILRPLAPPVFSTIISLRYTTVYATTDFAGASVSLSEFGIYADRATGGGPALDPLVGTYTPVAYKTVDPPLAKNNTNTLTVRWGFRF